MAFGRRLRGALSVGLAASRRPPRAALAGGTLAGLAGLAVLGCVAGAGCGVGGGASLAGAPVLYVSNSRDGTLTRIDTASGRVVGAPVPAGRAPWNLAVTPPVTWRCGRTRAPGWPTARRGSSPIARASPGCSAGWRGCRRDRHREAGASLPRRALAGGARREGPPLRPPASRARPPVRGYPPADAATPGQGVGDANRWTSTSACWLTLRKPS
jgi:YVTN family beta-propeller protein